MPSSRLAAMILCLGPALHVAHGQQPQDAAPAKPLYVSASAMAGNVLHVTQPVYPEVAKDRAITGVVTVKVFVGANGTVTRAEPFSGPDELQQAAAACVRQWTFKPYELDGKPIPIETTATVHFNGKTVKRTGPIPPRNPLPRGSDGTGVHYTGTVTMDVTVGADGRVKDIKATSTSKPLEYIVVSQVKRWVYTPGTEDGVPCESKTHFTFTMR